MTHPLRYRDGNTQSIVFVWDLSQKRIHVGRFIKFGDGNCRPLPEQCDQRP
jgi:hypothetical protein